jgi:hypothetical protein
MRGLQSLTFTNLPPGETEQLIKTIARGFPLLHTLRVDGTPNHAQRGSGPAMKVTWVAATELRKLKHLHTLELSQISILAPPKSVKLEMTNGSPNVILTFMLGFACLRLFIYGGNPYYAPRNK